MNKKIVDGKKLIDEKNPVLFWLCRLPALESSKDRISNIVLNENDIQNHSVRNILILRKSPVKIKKSNYLEILGIDIFSQKLVKIIDNRGKDFNLCKDDKSWNAVHKNNVIKIPCDIFDEQYLNTLRMTGPFEMIGESNPYYLKKKMRYLGVRNKYPFHKIDIASFKSILKNYPNKHLIARVQIHGTILQAPNSQIRIQMGNIYAKFEDASPVMSNHINKILRGIAWIDGVFENDKYNLTIKSITHNYSFFDTTKEYKNEITIEGINFSGVSEEEYEEPKYSITWDKEQNQWIPNEPKYGYTSDEEEQGYLSLAQKYNETANLNYKYNFVIDDIYDDNYATNFDIEVISNE